MSNGKVKGLLAVIVLLMIFQTIFLIGLGSAIFIVLNGFEMPDLSQLDLSVLNELNLSRIHKIIELIPADKLVEMIERCREINCFDHLLGEINSYPLLRPEGWQGIKS